MKNITLSALFRRCLRKLSGRSSRFARLAAQQHEVHRGVVRFSARDRLDRDAIHERVLR